MLLYNPRTGELEMLSGTELLKYKELHNREEPKSKKWCDCKPSKLRVVGLRKVKFYDRPEYNFSPLVGRSVIKVDTYIKNRLGEFYDYRDKRWNTRER